MHTPLPHCLTPPLPHTSLPHTPLPHTPTPHPSPPHLMHTLLKHFQLSLQCSVEDNRLSGKPDLHPRSLPTPPLLQSAPPDHSRTYSLSLVVRSSCAHLCTCPNLRPVLVHVIRRVLSFVPQQVSLWDCQDAGLTDLWRVVGGQDLVGTLGRDRARIYILFSRGVKTESLCCTGFGWVISVCVWVISVYVRAKWYLELTTFKMCMLYVYTCTVCIVCGCMCIVCVHMCVYVHACTCVCVCVYMCVCVFVPSPSLLCSLACDARKAKPSSSTSCRCLASMMLEYLFLEVDGVRCSVLSGGVFWGVLSPLAGGE